MSPAQTRVDVRKTYKLFIGGAFPRSESGRSYEVYAAPTRAGNRAFLANAAKATRKDARNAVVAARKAVAGWAGATAYNRGQVLYRVAEVMESRREQLVAEVRAAEGLTAARGAAQVEAAIDRWVWYSGWTDKITQVTGNLNPVAGPYFNVSAPEPTGVVAVVAPQDDSLLGLISVVAPVIATGNTCVVIAAQEFPLPSITLAECLATSDVPGGVVNVLTGDPAEMAPWLASHLDVNGLDLAGAGGLDWASLEAAAADNLKRVRRPSPDEDFAAEPSLSRMTDFLETKTVWHPKGR